MTLMSQSIGRRKRPEELDRNKAGIHHNCHDVLFSVGLRDQISDHEFTPPWETNGTPKKLGQGILNCKR